MTREEFLERIDEIMCGTSNAERTYLENLYDEVTKPHWISVEELPKDGIRVATITKTGIQDVRYRYNGKWFSNFGNEYNDVTHWFPLPESPVLSNSSNIGKDLKGGDE